MVSIVDVITIWGFPKVDLKGRHSTAVKWNKIWHRDDNFSL